MIHRCATLLVLLAMIDVANAQAPATQPTTTQAQLEADLSSLLSGATLEGSFTSTNPGSDPTKLTTDKYTLGTVRKVAGKIWLIQAQIGSRGGMIPIPIPIEWAGNTPVIVVDDMTIPGMGTYSARVMFFDGHYSGYWKHGDRGGNMFGVIRKAPATAPAATP